MDYESYMESPMNNIKEEADTGFFAEALDIIEPEAKKIRRNEPLSDVPDFLEPFKYNWKRKLVYRSIKAGQVKNGPVADVCYVSPTGQKFWSFKRLKQHLSLNKNGLKGYHFTYVPRPLGLNDETKEIFDYSRQLASVQSEAPSTVDSTYNIGKRTSMPNTLRTKSSRNIVDRRSKEFPNKLQLEPKLKLTRIKRTKKNSFYTSTDISTEVSEVESENNYQNRRYEKYFRQSNSMQALIDYHKSLQSIFSKLEVADLLRVRLVCTTWRDIADKSSFWHKIAINNLRIINWNKFSEFLESHKTKYLNLKQLADVEFVNWECAASAIANTNVTELEISGCSAAVAAKISETCKRLHSLSVTLVEADTIDLDSMDKMNQHNNGEAMKVTYESRHGISLHGGLAPLLSLNNLTHLTLTTLKDLKTLELGESFANTSIQDLRYLRLERNENRALINFNVINGISSLTRLEHLELIDFEIEENFDLQLQKCVHLKSLLLIPSQSVATCNQIILKGILSLKENLKYVIWGVHVQEMKKTKNLLWRQNEECHRDVDFIPIIEPVPFLYLIDSNTSIGNKQEKNEDESTESMVYSIKILQLSQLEKLIMKAMPNTFVSISKIEKMKAAEVPEIKEHKFYTVYTDQ